MGNTTVSTFEFENYTVIAPVKTLEILFAEVNGSDAVALYFFYYKTAKRQRTNRVKATQKFCENGLHWGHKKFLAAKAILDKHNLVKSIQSAGQWYIQIGYIKKAQTSQKELLNSRRQTSQNELLTIDNNETNALDITNVISCETKVSTSSKCFNPEGHKSCIENLQFIDKTYRKHLLQDRKNFKFQELLYKAGATDEDMLRIIKALSKEVFYQKNGWDMSTIYSKYINGGANVA